MATGTVIKKESTPTVEKTVVDIVSEKVNEFLESGKLNLPRNYSVDNALKSAYLSLHTVKDKNDKLVMVNGKLTGVCTNASIANAVLDMVIQGLNPNKKQCYFIVHGDSLTCRRSYFGSMAVAEMVNPAIKDWGYDVVYEGDTFKFEIHNGKKSVIEHVQELENMDKLKIVAAYAMALDHGGNPIKSEIMTIDEIHDAWKMSPTDPFDNKGELKTSSTHRKFLRAMALRTVINKVAKLIINASSDNALLLERINQADDFADAAEVQEQIEEKANKGSLIMIPDDGKPKVEEGKGQKTGPDEVKTGPEVLEPPQAPEKNPGEVANGRKPSF